MKESEKDEALARLKAQWEKAVDAKAEELWQTHPNWSPLQCRTTATRELIKSHPDLYRLLAGPTNP